MPLGFLTRQRPSQCEERAFERASGAMNWTGATLGGATKQPGKVAPPRNDCDSEAACFGVVAWPCCPESGRTLYQHIGPGGGGLVARFARRRHRRVNVVFVTVPIPLRVHHRTHPKEIQMRYPAPKRLLYELSITGPSSVRSEAIRLLGLPSLPAAFPPCERRSRASLLRRLACNRKKSAKARLAAAKEILFGWTDEMEQAIKGDKWALES